MQNRIKECTDYETWIRDDLVELLKEIKKKMYDPERAKYEYATLTESLTLNKRTTKILQTIWRDLNKLET